jgi:hypothetical protein
MCPESPGVAVSACEHTPFVRLEQALQQGIAPLRRLGVKPPSRRAESFSIGFSESAR